MQYIVLDLEWNQPINYQNRIYRLYGDRLVFEMIQIGAVRIDENLNLDTLVPAVAFYRYMMKEGEP